LKPNCRESRSSTFVCSIKALQTGLRVGSLTIIMWLGNPFMSCGLSVYDVTFHLVNNAFFKALLFLAAYVLYHNMKHVHTMNWEEI
jgi:formate hydrogenlyase subunit 3/multisubunit Na+/H+ antiporter MnhD subunit